MLIIDLSANGKLEEIYKWLYDLSKIHVQVFFLFQNLIHMYNAQNDIESICIKIPKRSN